MFKREDYLHFTEILNKIQILETLNRNLDEYKLSKLLSIKDEKINEFISTNNIEGDIVSFSNAQKIIKESLCESDVQKRWIGIKYAHNILWSNKYQLNSEYIHEIHRALMRNVPTIGGAWKTKLNQVGSLITALPEEVPSLMNNLLTNFLSSKLTEGSSVFNIIPFVSEFLAIHPYEDGNGRMSRLLMNRELYNAGYKFVKYISISKYLWDRRDEYVKALEYRNNAWAAKTLQPLHLIPLFNVLLDSLIDAAKKAHHYLRFKRYAREEFKKRVVAELFNPKSISDITKDLLAANSRSSIVKWLNELVDEGKIKQIGKLKSAKYETII